MIRSNILLSIGVIIRGTGSLSIPVAVAGRVSRNLKTCHSETMSRSSHVTGHQEWCGVVVSVSTRELYCGPHVFAAGLRIDASQTKLIAAGNNFAYLLSDCISFFSSSGPHQTIFPA